MCSCEVLLLCAFIPPWRFIHQLLSSFCISILLAITVMQLSYCMLLCYYISVVNPSVNLDLLFGGFVGYGKCILFPFAEVTGFSNENKYALLRAIIRKHVWKSEIT